MELLRRRLRSRSGRVAQAAAAVGLTLALRAGRAAAAARVGEPAPAFSLRDLAGGEVSLEELRGNVVCLDFWATWCGACANELPALAGLGERFRARGVSVVAVSIDRRRDRLEGYVAQHLAAEQRAGAIRVLHDPDGDVLSRYGADGMPALYLIDRDGTVRAIASGYSEEGFAEFAQRVEALLGPAATPAALGGAGTP